MRGPPDHVGIVVEDLDAAIAELRSLAGLRFVEPQVVPVGPWRLRVAFARSGPPYLELIEAQAGTPWETSAALDHLAWFSDDLEADMAALAAVAPVELDGTAHGRRFSYHRAPATGMRIELVGSTPEAFAERWGLDQGTIRGG
jgi:hypothetical protein